MIVAAGRFSGDGGDCRPLALDRSCFCLVRPGRVWVMVASSGGSVSPDMSDGSAADISDISTFSEDAAMIHRCGPR
ncbi:hypothetical protein, partial [Dactylosporangium siamense]|uniref:hypothetical protein n=1 Tax=Dactylosporangium siamense TaxID=685454 RepID=UPI0019416EB7